MFQLGPMEIGLVLVIILIVFGVGKLPQVGGAIGRGIHEFRKASHSGDNAEEKPAEEKPIDLESLNRKSRTCGKNGKKLKLILGLLFHL